MKRIAALVLLFAVAASAEPMRSPDGVIQEPPNRLPVNGLVITDPSPFELSAQGWTPLTPGEIAAYYEGQASAAASAAAEAEAQAGLPAVFDTGIAVLDESGHHIELVPTGDGLPILGAQVSNSPLTKEERDRLKAAMKAAAAARKERAKAAKNEKEQVALLMEAVFGIVE